MFPGLGTLGCYFVTVQSTVLAMVRYKSANTIIFAFAIFTKAGIITIASTTTFPVITRFGTVGCYLITLQALSGRITNTNGVFVNCP